MKKFWGGLNPPTPPRYGLGAWQPTEYLSIRRPVIVFERQNDITVSEYNRQTTSGHIFSNFQFDGTSNDSGTCKLIVVSFFGGRPFNG